MGSFLGTPCICFHILLTLMFRKNMLLREPDMIIANDFANDIRHVCEFRAHNYVCKIEFVD